MIIAPLEKVEKKGIFEYMPSWQGDTTLQKLSEISKPTTSTLQQEIPGKNGILKAFSLEQEDGIFGLLLLNFLLFGYVCKGGLGFFKESTRMVFTSRKNINLFSETTTRDFWYNFILLFQAILLGSIIIFSHLIEKNGDVPQHSFLTTLSFIASIYIFIGLKYLLYRLIGYLFESREIILIWIRSYITVLEIGGIIAFIPTLFLIYSNHYHTIILVFLTIIFLISRLIIIYRTTVYFLHQKVNFLFLIVYLCSIEILPYIFLYGGLIYLYELDITSIL